MHDTTPPAAVPEPLCASTETHVAASPYWEERQRLAMQIRAMGNHLLSRQAHETDIRKLADEIERFNQRIKQEPELAGRKGWMDAGLYADQDALSLEMSPLIGKSSGVGPLLKIWIENGEGRGEVNCDWRFEGPPMCLHGGYVAALFDEFLGWAQMLSGGSGATKNLNVTYHRPTPLNATLLLKARLVSVEGRRIRVNGEMYAGDVMTASAEGLFIFFGKKGTTELYKKL